MFVIQGLVAKYVVVGGYVEGAADAGLLGLMRVCFMHYNIIFACETEE